MSDMKVIEILKFNRELIENLSQVGIRLDDARFVSLYDDYCRMTASGDKVSYAVAVLSERYHVCERKVYSLLKRMGTECVVKNFRGG